MYIMIEDITINDGKPFIAEVPKVLAFSRSLLAPYLRTHVVHFCDIDFSFRELSLNASNFTANCNQYQDFDCELISSANYESQEEIKLMVTPLHANRMITIIKPSDIEDSDGDIKQALFSSLFDYLQVDFEYAVIHDETDNDQLKLKL